MTDILDLAARLEAACDITGKPTGRHMIDGMTKLAAAQIAMGEDGDDVARNLGEANACLVGCIESEAKLFDDLAAVAKEAAEVFRLIGSELGDTIIQGKGSLFEGAAFALVGATAEEANPKDGTFALVFNISDNAAAWTSPWVVGYWSAEAHQWFDHEGYPLTPSHVVKLPSAEIFMQAEGVNLDAAENESNRDGSLTTDRPCSAAEAGGQTDGG